MDGESNKYKLPYTLVLKHPIERGTKAENAITQLVFKRRLKAKDFKGIPAAGMQFDHMLKLVSRLSAEPISTIEEMDSEDLFAATDIVNSFLPSGLTTGETS